MKRTPAILLANVLLLAGLLALAGTPREGPVSESVRVERGDATRATIDLSAEAGRIRLVAQPTASRHALTGSIDVAPRERLVGQAEVTSGHELAIRYAARQLPGPHLSVTGPQWDLALAPDIATELRVRTVVGEAELDLRGARVRTLSSRGEAGRQVIHLPEGVSEATVRTDVGSIELYLPAEANADIVVRTGMATVRAGSDLVRTRRGYRLDGEGDPMTILIETSLGSVTLGTY